MLSPLNLAWLATGREKVTYLPIIGQYAFLCWNAGPWKPLPEPELCLIPASSDEVLCGGLNESGLRKFIGSDIIRRCGLAEVGVALL